MNGLFVQKFRTKFFVLAVKVKLFIGARILAQMHLKNVDEIDSRSHLLGAWFIYKLK
jgi:hypothetical protein